VSIMSETEHGHKDHEHGHGEEHSHEHHEHGDCCSHDHDDDHCGHAHGHDGTHVHEEHGHGHSHEDVDTGPVFDPAAFGGEDLCGDGGLYKKILTQGDPDAGCPPTGSKVKVHYVGTLLNGSEFDSSRKRPGYFEFELGVRQVILGWDKGVASMNKGEKALLACRADYAYGERGSPPKIPGGATLIFEVELFRWKEKLVHKDTLDEKGCIGEADRIKSKGTASFKCGEFEEAAEYYRDAASYIDYDFTPPAGSEEQVKSLLLSCLLNGAMCALKTDDWKQANMLSNAALAHDPSSVKAFFRRGQARMGLLEYEGAKADFKKASELDPKSREAREAFNACVQKEASDKKEERDLYRQMLGKK